MIVVTNRIPVAQGHEIDFEDRFRRRVHLVDRAPGFLRNEVHRPRPVRFDHESGGWVPDPEAPGSYEVKTWWRSMEDFVAWTRSPAFAEAHANRAPREMFAGPSKLEVHEVMLSTDLGDEAH
jgi:heme-degrading monooxygenase HmoA